MKRAAAVFVLIVVLVWSAYAGMSLAQEAPLEGATGLLDLLGDVVMYGAIEILPDAVYYSCKSTSEGKGSLYILLVFPQERLCLRGAASGTFWGGFVKPDNPHTTQREEVRGFTFVVTTESKAPCLPKISPWHPAGFLGG